MTLSGNHTWRELQGIPGDHTRTSRRYHDSPWDYGYAHHRLPYLTSARNFARLRRAMQRSRRISRTESDSDFDSGGVAPLHAVPAPQIGSYARALQMIARLGQPFSALLLVRQPDGEFKRVAVDEEFIISRLGIDITSKKIRTNLGDLLMWGKSGSAAGR